MYLKSRISFVSKEFHPRVVRRDRSVRKRQDVDQEFMVWFSVVGKSEPRSTIHDMACEEGGGEKRRAPTAE